MTIAAPLFLALRLLSVSASDDDLPYCNLKGAGFEEHCFIPPNPRGPEPRWLHGAWQCPNGSLLIPMRRKAGRRVQLAFRCDSIAFARLEARASPEAAP